MTRDSEDETSTKSCFSGFLGRILCTGTLPTHSSNSVIVPESDNLILEKKNLQVIGQGSPGVVARLMGLQSLPDNKWIPKDANNLRSRSLRSADYFPQFDHSSEESQHRRVKTSVSFREIPTFLHQQNEDLFVVCFDKRDNNNAKGLKMMASPDKVMESQDTKEVKSRSKSASRNTKERVVVMKEKQQIKKRNVEPKRSSSKASNLLPYYTKSSEVYIRSSPRIKKKRPTKPPNSFCEEVSSGMKHARIRKNRRTTSQARIESNSSTGSCSESMTITSENSRKTALNLNPQKYSIPKLENVDYPCPKKSCKRSNGGHEQEVTSANLFTKSDGLMKSKEMDFYVKKFVEVCRLNEEDTKRSHDWRWLHSESLKFDDIENTCLDFEQYILDMLLQQVVDELC